MPPRSEQDIVACRLRVRQLAQEAKFSLVDQTNLITAASELARKAVSYGARVGDRLAFEDKGPGIADVALALKDG